MPQQIHGSDKHSGRVRQLKWRPCGPPFFYEARLVSSSLTGRRKTMRADATWNRCIPGDDPTGGDVSHRDLLSTRADDVLEHAVRVEKGIPVVIADNHTVVADAFELCIAVNHLPVVQRSKGAIPIDESVINSAAIPRIHVYADNHAVIVERSRNGRDRAGKVRHGKKRSVAATLKDVRSVGITVGTEEGVKVVDPCKCCAVVRCVGMDDQGCG